MNSFLNYLKQNFNIFTPVIFVVLGLIIVFYPMFISPDKMPGDLGDMRFVNYVLEHGFLWLKQNEIHNSFWNMPFFYPYNNTLAYSDMLIGGMVIYAPLRFFIDSPFTTMQVWFVLCSLLNFLSFYLFMTKVCKFKEISASAASFLFAFGLPRQVQIGHAQLYLQFYMIFSITSFCCIKYENTKFKNNILFLTGTLMFVLQLYTSYYFGWFTVFGAVTAFVISICYPDLRKIIFKKLVDYRKEIFFCGILSFILLMPFINHYLAVGSKFSWELSYLPTPLSLVSSKSFLDDLIIHNKFLKIFNGEIIDGIGFITSVIVLIGLLKFKNRLQILLYIGLVLYFFINPHANYLLYTYFPGAVAIRAAGRCIFIILIVLSVGLAKFLQQQKIAVAMTFALIVILEQIPYQTEFFWTKSEHNIHLKRYIIPKQCKAIYYGNTTYVEDLDIMWFANNNNIRTSNGYSGYVPPYLNGFIPENCIIELKLN